jgi:DNA polymerase-3 subunit beta
MKVSLLAENITSTLPLLNKILPSHSQVPILSNILLLADNTGFYIKATDLELGVEIKIPAKIEEEGMITVPGKEFIEALSNFPKDKIVIEAQKEKTVLTSRGNTVSFNTISGKEFPSLYKEKGVEVAVFKMEEFTDIFSYLTFAVSNEESRPQLTGVYINKKEDGIDFVSTDGYRMSVKTVMVDKNKFEESPIISVKLINEVLALKKTDSVILRINKKENQITFEVGDIILVGRMIEGSFPDYEKVIPKSSKTTITIDREEFLQNVRLASVFAKDTSNIVNIEIKNNTVSLSTKAQGVGEGESVMEAKQVGEDNRISFNVKYLFDLVKTVTEREIVLKLNSANEPALFEVKEKSFNHIIMPIQAD